MTANAKIDEIVKAIKRIDEAVDYRFSLSVSVTIHSKTGTAWQHLGEGLNDRLAKALLPEVPIALARVRTAMLGELLAVEAQAERDLAQLRERRAEIVKIFRLGVK